MYQVLGVTFIEGIKQLTGNRSFSQIYMESGPLAHLSLLSFIILLIIGIRIVFKSKSRKKFWIYSLFISLPFFLGFLGSFFGFMVVQDIIQNNEFKTIIDIKDLSVSGISMAMGPTYFGIIQSFILIILVFISLNKQNRKMENIIKERTEELDEANNKLTEEKQHILDSIQYASLIQNSILPKKDELSQYIKDFFIIWKPRDIVGGDFYWFYPIPDTKNYIISVIDCTGHGVPGAFMSMTANSILNNIVREKQIYEPDKILNLLHKEIRYTLRQQAKESQQDGMDISICYINVKSQEIHFAGALQSLYFARISNIQQGISNDEVIIERIRGDRFSIGGRQKEEERIFTKHILQYNSGDSIYLLSDGLADQKIKIDGKETRLKTKRVEEMIRKYCSFPMKEQKEKIEEELIELQGEIEQRDDIAVIGLKMRER